MMHRSRSVTRWMMLAACIGLILWIVSGPSLAQEEGATEEPAISAPADIPTDAPTDVPPTEVPPTDIPTNAPTDVPPTDIPTVAPTDIPTDTSTDIPTDTPTDVPTDTPIPSTEAPTDVATPTDTPTETATTETATTEPTATSTALPDEPALQSLAHESFDSGDLSHWRLDDGWTLTLVEGGLAIGTSATGSAEFISPALANVVVEARVQAGETVELAVRKTDTSAYTLVLSPDGQVILRRNGDDWQTASVEPSQSDQWRTLRLSALNGVIRAAVDGVEVIGVVDANPLPAGSVALSADVSGGGQVLVDDVKLSIPADEALPILTETATLEPTEAATAEATVEPTVEVTAEATLEPTPEVTEVAPSDSALTLIFQDDFTSGAAADWQLADGWTVADDDGNAVLRDGDSSGAAALSTIDRYSTVAQAQVRLDGGVARLSVRQSESGAYTAALGANDTLNLFRGETLVAATGLDSPVEGDWHTLKLSAIDGDVTVSVDDEDVIEWTDDDPLPPGSVAFSAQSASGLALDDVQVWVPSDEPMATALLASPQSGSIYKVITTTMTPGNTCDPNGCSFPQALNAANANSGSTIEFHIPGDGPFTLLEDGLNITASMTIDGTTQEGYDGTPLIELRTGSLSATRALTVGDETHTNLTVTIRGLAISGNYTQAGLILYKGTGHIIEDNYFGVRSDGTNSGSNRGMLVYSYNTTIRRNLIAANYAEGIELLTIGSSDIGATIVGNKILDNGVGISITVASYVTVGGLTEADRNIISGNSSAGISMPSQQAGHNKVIGNYIGTEADGVTARPNGYGISIELNTDNVIGGTDSITPGGSCTGACNVISGNTLGGIYIGGVETAENNTVSGNFIGPDVTGTKSVGSQKTGIYSNGSIQNIIGGTEDGATNVISGNAGPGITVDGGYNLYIENNIIGADSSGANPLPNLGNGVFVKGGASYIIIGDTVTNAPNLIAHNRPPDNSGGVWVSANSYAVQVIGNAIYDNSGLGVDLAPIGVNPNDAQDTSGPANGGQNFPVMGFFNDGSVTHLYGTLHSQPNTTFLLDIYTNETCDSSGYGEGEVWAYTWEVTTNSKGDVSFQTVLAELWSDDTILTAKLLNESNYNTSEFSPCFYANANVSVALTSSANPAPAGTNLTYTATISNAGDSLSNNNVVQVTLPLDVTFVQAIPTSGTCTQESNIVTCQLGQISSNTSVSVAIKTTVNLNASPSFTASASVTSDTPDNTAANNSTTLNISTGSADLSLTNSDSPDPVVVGSTLRYTLKASNKGPQAAPLTVITDTLPAGVTFVPATSSPSCTYSAPTVTCAVGSIANGGSATVVIDASVNIGTTGTLTNTASVSSPARDTVTTNNSATTTTRVNQPPTPGKVSQTTPADKGATNDTTPAVNWTALTGGGSPFSYDVQFATNNTFTANLQTIHVPSGTTASPDTAFAPGTIYWRVRAQNVVSVPGAWSNARSLIIDITAPTAPALSSPADGAQVSSAKPALSWTASSGATLYRVDIATDAAFTTLVVTDGAATKTSFSPATSLAQGQYYWRMQAGDAAGNWSSESTSRSFVVFIGTSPTDGAFTNTKPAFKWASVSGSSSYTVEIATNTDFNPIFRSQSSTKTSLTLSSALAGGTYYWRVRSSFDSSPLPTFPYRMMLVGTATAPTQTSPADKGFAGSLTPTVQWNAVTLTGITTVGYQVQTATDSKFSKNLTTYPLTSSTSQVLNSLTEGSVRYWRVRAIFGDSTLGPLSATRSFTVDITPPGIPSLTSPANNAQTSATRPTLSWSSTGSPTRFQIDVASDVNFNSIEFTKADQTTASLTLTTSLAQGRHYWRVKASDAAGNSSAFSGTQSFFVFIGTAPANGSFISTLTPTFTWAAVTGATGYRLQVADNSDFTTPLVDQSVTTTSTAASPALTANTHYYWRVYSSFDTIGNDIGYRELYTGASTVAPTLTYPADKAVINSQSPELTWTEDYPPDDIALKGYQIQIATDNKITKNVQNFSESVASLSMPVTLADGTTFYWRVRQILFDSATPGPWSAVRSFTVDVTPPKAFPLSSPSNGATTSDSTPTFSWKSSSGAANYKIQIADDSGFTTNLSTSSAVTSTSYTPSTPLSNGLHYWRVVAYDRASNSRISDAPARTITINAP